MRVDGPRRGRHANGSRSSERTEDAGKPGSAMAGRGAVGGSGPVGTGVRRHAAIPAHPGRDRRQMPAVPLDSRMARSAQASASRRPVRTPVTCGSQHAWLIHSSNSGRFRDGWPRHGARLECVARKTRNQSCGFLRSTETSAEPPPKRSPVINYLDAARDEATIRCVGRLCTHGCRHARRLRISEDAPGFPDKGRACTIHL